MRRQDMIACGRHAERIRMICELMDFDETVKAKVLAEADAIQALLEDETERQRAYDRSRKKKDSGGFHEVPTDSNGNQRIPKPTVVEEEGVVEAEEVEVATPPPFIVPSVSMEDVDAVLAGFNEITGSSLRVGSTRSKKAAEKVRSLLVRLTKEEGDVEAARRRLGRVVMWLWKERAGTDYAKFVVPSTVCSPSKFDGYEEQMGVPTNGTANGMSRASFDDAVAACDACRWTKIDFPHRVHCQQHSRLLRDGEVSA